MLSSRRIKFFLVNFVLFLISTVVTLIILEIFLLFIPLDKEQRHSLPLFDLNSPHNSLGFRDFEYSRQKRADQFRIIVVGDSFTWGGGVNFDDTFPKRLERYLNSIGERAEVTYQVENMGLNRKSTPEEVELAKKMAYETNPDLIILQYALNDTEDWQRPNEILSLRKKYFIGHFKEPTGRTLWLYKRSALTRLAIHRLHNFRENRGLENYYHALYENDYSGWQKTREGLQQLATFSSEKGIPALLVIFPLFSFGLDDSYPFSYIHDLLHDTAEKAGLPYLDLFENFRGLNNLRMEAVPYQNPHPSEIAHRIAAEALWQNLIEWGILPTKSTVRKSSNVRPVASPY